MHTKFNCLLYIACFTANVREIRAQRPRIAHDNGGLNVRFYGRAQRRASRRGTARHGTVRHARGYNETHSSA